MNDKEHQTKNQLKKNIDKKCMPIILNINQFLPHALRNKDHQMALNLKELLQAIIRPEKNWKTDLLYRWRDIIGSLHSKVRIEKIHDDTLILGVFNSCWMQELYLLSPLLIK